MRFVCEHCDTKYNIADEKVRNKTVKIRCRKCGEVIEVRAAEQKSAARPEAKGASKTTSSAVKPKDGDKRKADAAGSKLEDRFASSFKKDKPASSGTPGLFQAVKESAETLSKDDTELVVWFVAVNDNPVGPIAARDVQRYVRAGKVGDDSLVWKEGMPDWVPLRHAKDLVGLLARLDLELTLGDERSPAAPKAQRKLGLFAGEADEAPAEEGPLKGRDVGRVDVRRDAPKDEPAAAEKPAEQEGPAEAPDAPPAPQKSELDDELFDDFAAGMKSSVASIQSITPARIGGTDRWVKVAAVGFFVVAVVVLGAVLLLGGGAAESEAAETVVKVVEKVVEKEKIVYRDRPVVQTDEAPEDVVEDEPTRKGKGGKGKGSGKSGESAEEKKRRLLEQMGLTAPGSDPKLVGGKTPDQTGGSDQASAGGSDSMGLSKSQLSGVVRKNRGSAQTCYERSLKQGESPEGQDVKVVISITVGASGMVKRASIGGPGARYTGLKSCLTQTVKKWVFPASKGESKVEYPFLFTPK